MNPLISLSDFSKASGIKNKMLAAGIMRFAGIHKINKLYETLYPHKGQDFTAAFFKHANIKLEVDENELSRIPKTGAFITISNHPYGGADGLALLELVGRRRPDYKVMANFLLKRIEPISDRFISVNPFEDYKHVASSVSGMKLAAEHVAAGNSLGIFPAGEVSTRQKELKGIVDRDWQKPALKLIRKAGVPIIPIYFHGHNSWSFHLLGRIHPLLRTLRLPHELSSTKQRTIRVRIGNPISVNEQAVFSDSKQFGKYLRAKTYSLGSAFTQKKKILPTINLAGKPEPIESGISKELLADDLARVAHLKVLSQQNFDLYLAPAKLIPNILFEIGRLREITFRKEGEGTNKALDLDKFDDYYEHLFLYDREASEVVGAYRIGKGSEIVKTYGRKGFYTNTLFRMKDGFIPILHNALELGRSFIVPEYQNKRLPLFLLWRGILTFLMNNQQYKYIIGPVSISNYYSHVSKSIIVAFIQRHYFDQGLARYIKPKKKYKIEKRILEEAESLLDSSGNDVRKLDKIIDDIEPAIKSAPILLKKYIHQNARIIGFNVDPAFNQALDGLMILDITKLPQDTIDNLKRELAQNKE
jgi:putative hemolysin